MDLSAARIVLRPRSLIELNDLALRFIFALGGALYLRLAALTLVPGLVLTAWLRHHAEWPWSQVWIATVVYGSVLQGVFTLAASRLLFSGEVRAMDAVRGYLRRLPSYLTALLLSRIVIVAGAATCVLALPAWARVNYVHEASLLEESGPRAAVQRSFAFTRGYLARGLINLLVLFSTTAVFLLATDLVLRGVVEDLLMLPLRLPPLMDTGGSVYAAVGYHASIPVVATGRFLAYIDARTRRDGWDIQVRFLALANAHRREGAT